MTTIAEVAKRACVGVATVSRVLNGSPSVSEATRQRVLDVVEELGYERNAAARALSTGRTRTLGVLAPFIAEPSVMERLRGITRVVAAAGYQLVLFDVEPRAPIAHVTAAGRVDGLLCISLAPSEADLVRFRASSVPVVLVDAEHPKLAGVSVDDVEGGRLAAQHLLELGHRRIGFVGDDEETGTGFASSARRRLGAELACRDAGAELLVRRAPHGHEPARLLAAELLGLSEPPTAIFAASDSQALGVLRAAEELGVDVPRELSVVGFDDIEAAGHAGLTTISQPLEDSGTEGARMLLEALGGSPRASRHLQLQLVVRATTARPRVASTARTSTRTTN